MTHEDIRYEIDEETQDYLREALEMLAMFVDMQCSEDARENLEHVVQTLADRFDIPYGKVEVTEGEDGGLEFTINDGETSGTVEVPNFVGDEDNDNYTEEANNELTQKGPGKEDTIH